MKRLLMLVLPSTLIMALTTGCLLGIPLENRPPVAYIDSIAPSDVSVGELVRFVGHGTDIDGRVVGYRWRSSLDGDLNTAASFETLALSAGNHTIYFSVQDNNGTWSAEVSKVVKILGNEPPPLLLPVILSFGADETTITEGESAALNWNVSGATAVSIDQEIGSVALTGSRTVSPSETKTYTLTATNDVGSLQTSTQIVVREAPPGEQTLTVFPVVNESGYVRDNGDVVPRYIRVGDDNNFSLQGFISFDISSIPDNARITRVIVDFSDYDRVSGDPFGSLGCLRTYVDNYGTLSGDDYVESATGTPLIRFCSVPEVKELDSNSIVADALQDAVGEARFRMRLQFRDTATDENDDNDLIAWTENHLPELRVTYTVP